MKRLLIFVAAGLAACATAPSAPSAPAPEGPLVEIRQSFTCPQPASRGLVTIARDGKAERVIFEGLDFEIGKTKSSREQMTLAPKDAAALFSLVADSDWRSLPEDAGGAPGPHDCSNALLIKTGEGGKSIRYGASRPAKLDALIKGIETILARGTWTRVVYEWEKQR